MTGGVRIAHPTTRHTPAIRRGENMDDLTLTLRPVTRRDWLGVLHVEGCLDLAWDYHDHAEFLLGEWNATAVACRGSHVIGFACVTVMKGYVVVERLAVADEWRRKGVGTALLWYVAKTYVSRTRPVVQAVVSEYDLPGQLFLRECGFRWVASTPFDGIDQYVMQRDYRHE